MQITWPVVNAPQSPYNSSPPRGAVSLTVCLPFRRFSLTLIDTLDTLAVSDLPLSRLGYWWNLGLSSLVMSPPPPPPQLLNKTTEFEEAVRKVLSDVRLDNDVVVSVFETNIRVLG